MLLNPYYLLIFISKKEALFIVEGYIYIHNVNNTYAIYSHYQTVTNTLYYNYSA